MVVAAVLANAAFVWLGAVFDYPDVLQQPADGVLARFHADPVRIGGGFLVLAAAAGLLWPVARGVGGPRLVVGVGAAAAVVQVVGLSRWFLVVPWLDDAETFRMLNLVLGVGVGETLGYALTAAWTWAVARDVVGKSAAVLIAVGVLAPLGVPGVDLANFAGYVGWSLWLVWCGVRSIVRNTQPTGGTSISAPPAMGSRSPSS